MNDAKGLLDWFVKRKGEKIDTGSRAHGLVVHDAVNELANAVAAMGRGDADAAAKSVDRIVLCEREADRVEETLTSEMAKGSLTIQEREDLLHFIKKTDKIADWCLDAGTYVQLIIETGIRIPNPVWESMSAMTKELQLAVKLLVSAIDCLQQGAPMEDATRCVESVKDQERVVDSMYYTGLKKVLVSDMDFRGVMLARSLFDDIEEAADACKNCAETIILIISTRGE